MIFSKLASQIITAKHLQSEVSLPELYATLQRFFLVIDNQLTLMVVVVVCIWQRWQMVLVWTIRASHQSVRGIKYSNNTPETVITNPQMMFNMKHDPESRSSWWQQNSCKFYIVWAMVPFIYIQCEEHCSEMREGWAGASTSTTLQTTIRCQVPSPLSDDSDSEHGYVFRNWGWV